MTTGLSFLYGNFTTLTRFTELDYERVVTERLSPLYVSIHATDPEVRAAILQNRRGAVSLRWLRLLLDAGIEVHGQVVVCPGVNDGDVLADTLVGVLDRFSELRTLCVVPLGLSRFNRRPRMRPHTMAEAVAVLELVHRWQRVFLDVLGRRLVFAADEYYIMCGRSFPPAEHYEGVDMQEDGIGMARAFELEFHGIRSGITAPRSGFFAWVDGAPADGYRAPRSGAVSAAVSESGAVSAAVSESGVVSAAVSESGSVFRGISHYETGAASGGAGNSAQCRGLDQGVTGGGASAALGGAGSSVRVAFGRRRGAQAPVGVLTGTLGATVITPLVSPLNSDVRVVPVENRFFGGNIGVTGLITGSDTARVLADEPPGHRYLLPDVCLSRGLFLDGLSPADMPRRVEVIATHGRALRQALQGH